MSSDERRQLIERTHQIQELARHPGWALLVDRARVRLYAKQQVLLGGNVDDMLQYKFEAGFVQGAQYVLGLPDALKTAQEVTEENERQAQAG